MDQETDSRIMRKRVVFTIVIMSLLSAYSIEPWVKPYDRAHLADPVMKPNRDPVSSAYLNHVHDAREGAKGLN